MHGRAIQRGFSIRNPQKSSGLLIGRFIHADGGHDGGAGPEWTLGRPIGDNSARQLLVQAGNIAQQRFACRVDVDANFVDAILNGLQQSPVQFFLVHIVLILSHTDQLRIYFDEFGKRILQPARQADGTSGGGVPVREFVSGNPGRGVNRNSGIVHRCNQDVAKTLFGNNLAQSGFEFARSCSRPYRDGADAVFCNEFAQYSSGFFYFRRTFYRYGCGWRSLCFRCGIRGRGIGCRQRFPEPQRFQSVPLDDSIGAATVSVRSFNWSGICQDGAFRRFCCRSSCSRDFGMKVRLLDAASSGTGSRPTPQVPPVKVHRLRRLLR